MLGRGKAKSPKSWRRGCERKGLELLRESKEMDFGGSSY